MSSAEDFDRLSQIEHVLQRPDTYIGSIEITEEPRWVYKDNKIIRQLVTYNPGLEQCFMEILTNATDRTQNKEYKVSKIDVKVTEDTIEVLNDGAGIPVEMHQKHKIYVPELIFGNMLSGSNFKNKKRTCGGKNGIGAKACNIFSKSFTIITVWKGKKYEQTWTDNMDNKSKPKITNVKGKDYTKIIFQPDLKRFHMKKLHENDTIKLIHKRTVDASAVTHKKITVTYNGTKIPIKDFQDYMNLYIGSKKDTPRVYIDKMERWTIGFALNPYSSAEQISFVNGICTEEGGTHVNHVLEPVLNRVVKELQEKHKDVTIRKSYIKDNVIIFVNSLIEDPSFNSQTKKMHTTPVSKFGSRVGLSDDIIKKVIKLGISNGILEIARAKELKNLSKTDGKKKVRLSGIPKLDDAHWAGTAKSKECTLILTEGDSAKASALAGLAVVGKEKYGVFPLKGKLLNTRDASPAKIGKNEEIININKIIGLVHGEKHENFKGLRYGKIMVMTDADSDGFHIRGLIINYIACFWPYLLEQGFVCSLITPVVKAFKGRETKSFYDINDYEQWKEGVNNVNSWRIKYYKGLGTSSAKESKEYFANMAYNKIDYTYKSKTKDQKSLELAFTDSKKVNTDKRKEWITKTLAKKPKVDYNIKKVSIHDFINKELVQFSIYDNERSLPHVMDGLKVSQRKILYSCLKRKLFLKSDGSGEIKVAQLSGYVSEHSSYHHGEVSLQGAIIGMAQNFVGSNNINLLYPSGQFGTRHTGNDSASPRYIFTYLNGCVKDLFNEHDNKLLNYLNDDGFSIEPDFYVPTLPMILVNGSDGIGTGWSTTIPCFNPKDIIKNIKLLLEDENNTIQPMQPWYRGFKGTIEQISLHEWRSRGVIEVRQASRETIVKVTELPVGTVAQVGKRWIQTFKEYLDILEQRDEILSYKNNSTDIDVNFEISFRKKDVSSWDDDIFMSKLGLFGLIKTSNMHAFSSDGIIKKYNSAEEILWEFYQYRKKFYNTRKEYLVETLFNELAKLSEKKLFIKFVIDGVIEVFRKPKKEILEKLKSLAFVHTDILLDIKIHAFTKEKLDELENKFEAMREEYETIKSKTIHTMWSEDLDRFNLE